MKQKTQTTVAVSLRSDMQKSLDAITKKLQETQEIATTSYKAGSIFYFNPHSTGSSVTIKESVSIENLVLALGVLKMYKEAYDKAAQSLGFKQFVCFKWQGIVYEDWVHDITLRLKVVSQAETIKNLQVAKAKLESFLTEEDRLAITLSEIAEWTK